MSIPIAYCRVYKAALGDDAEFQELVKDMRYNLQCLAYSTWPCKCTPPCPKPTSEQMEDFNNRMHAALNKDAQ